MENWKLSTENPLNLKKADGWIAEWLDYYFTTYLKIDQMTQWDVKKEFSRHFPGLSNTLQELENMVQ